MVLSASGNRPVDLDIDAWCLKRTLQQRLVGISSPSPTCEASFDRAYPTNFKALQLGDMFVFPKGLVHYQSNVNAKNPATAISAFGSANAGTVSVPSTVFATGIDDNILAKAFKTDIGTIQKIKAGLAVKG
ncbi:hypothetical protein H0E87_016142 [Populus deltoides]|nr:hypothetical protein H0E87_016142 [Populus deltoides]